MPSRPIRFSSARSAGLPAALPVALFAGVLAFGVALDIPESRAGSSLYPTTVPRGSAGKLQHIRYGTIEGVRRVRIEGSKSGIGAAVGGVGGGVAGSAFGGGKRAKTLTTLGGALAGGIIGHKVEEETTKERGYEYTIQMDTGEHVAGIQGGHRPFKVGDRIQIIESVDNRPVWKRQQDGGATVRILPAPPGK